jgi:hypothetical protein
MRIFISFFASLVFLGVSLRIGSSLFGMVGAIIAVAISLAVGALLIGKVSQWVPRTEKPIEDL